MEYKKFKKIFDDAVLKNIKAELIKNIAKYPQRYAVTFRSTKPKEKLIQNLSQSKEIKFGGAFENVIEEYFKEFGCQILKKNINAIDGKKLEMDHFIEYKNGKYLIEQKIRDDHDSTKKVGQIGNFEKKIQVIINSFKSKRITGIFYFIDPNFTKNKKFYNKEIQKIRDRYSIDVYLFYGSEIFELFGHVGVWAELLQHLKQWKNETPDFPEINFDKNAKESFEEIKDIPLSVYLKILKNNKIYNEIILTIFPESKTLKLLLDYFEKKNKILKEKDRKVLKLLSQKLNEK